MDEITKREQFSIEIFNRTLANFIAWRVIQYATETILSPDSSNCVQLVTSNLPLATGAMFERAYSNEKAKEVAVELVDNIKKEFEDLMRTTTWLDDTTRASALKKERFMKKQIGNPKEFWNDTKLIDYHKDLNIDEFSYLKSIMSIKAFNSKFAHKELHEPILANDWRKSIDVGVANAYYMLEKNTISKFNLLSC